MKVGWFLWRSANSDDSCCLGCNSHTQHDGDIPNNDRRRGNGCDAPDKTNEFAEGDGEDEGRLRGEVFADFTPEWSEAAKGKEVPAPCDDTYPRPWNSSVIIGIAVPTIVYLVSGIGPEFD